LTTGFFLTEADALETTRRGGAIEDGKHKEINFDYAKVDGEKGTDLNRTFLPSLFSRVCCIFPSRKWTNTMTLKLQVSARLLLDQSQIDDSFITGIGLESITQERVQKKTKSQVSVMTEV
jgi:hypothetical protein